MLLILRWCCVGQLIDPELVLIRGSTRERDVGCSALQDADEAEEVSNARRYTRMVIRSESPGVNYCKIITSLKLHGRKV